MYFPLRYNTQYRYGILRGTMDQKQHITDNRDTFYGTHNSDP